MEPGESRLSQVERFDFRNLMPSVRFGTASDRYGGWIGQIYSAAWSRHVKTRRKKLGKATYTESVVPVEAVAEYFEHYTVLELDFTFYRPLVERDGSLSSNYRLIERYLDHAPPECRFLVKAPQMFCAPEIRGLGLNPDYLNVDAYIRQFHAPLLDLLGPNLAGVIFEQGYVPARKSPPLDTFIEDLDRFFASVPIDIQVHLEVRSPHVLQEDYFDWLETRGIGFLFSHWTWLPSLKQQWSRIGRFTAGDNSVVVRLLTPLKMPYATAYAKAHPFDQSVPDLTDAPGANEMIDDTVALVFKAIQRGKTIDVIANNRAWGNAPELSVAISQRILESERRRR